MLPTEKPLPHIPRLLFQKAIIAEQSAVPNYVEVVPCPCACHHRNYQQQQELSSSSSSGSVVAAARDAGEVEVPLQQRVSRLSRVGRDSSDAGRASALQQVVADREAGGSARRCECAHYTSTNGIAAATTTGATGTDGAQPLAVAVAAEECAWASCAIGGTRALDDAYLNALVRGMSELFAREHGISPQAVVRYYLEHINFANDPQGWHLHLRCCCHTRIRTRNYAYAYECRKSCTEGTAQQYRQFQFP